MYLVTFRCGNDFCAEFMRLWQIANLYGNRDSNDTSDHRVYRLCMTADPELLTVKEQRKGLDYALTLYTANGERVAGDEWPQT